MDKIHVYTDKELQEKYENFMRILNTVFTGERLEKLNFMYSEKELGANLILSPASGNVGFHSAYEGGYMDHVTSVAQNSLKVKKLYEEMGGKIDFTNEELLFSAFHHDLGKLGYPDKIHYIPNTSEWHVKNQGKLYVRNTELSYMTLTDRTFFTLSKYGISYTENEYFGIKLADGMYDDDNIKYLKTFSTDSLLRSNMPYIIHWADIMSTCVERDSILQTLK